MPTRKVVNANEVFPAYVVRQLQQRLKGKGMLVYVPALTEQADPPHNLWMVHDLTKRGWSASRVAAHLEISTRQVYRLRREAREHPERLEPKRPPMQEVYPPAKPAAPRKPSRAQIERRQQQTEQARHERIFGEEPPAPANNSDLIQVPRLRILPIERSDW